MNSFGQSNTKLYKTLQSIQINQFPRSIATYMKQESIHLIHKYLIVMRDYSKQIPYNLK
jgi:hypothetical protein